jgi:hypothetical protein
MGKPVGMRDMELTAAQKKQLIGLAKRDKALWKEIVRKRRHSIAHALTESRTFRMAAKKAKIIR